MKSVEKKKIVSMDERFLSSATVGNCLFAACSMMCQQSLKNVLCKSL